MATARQKKLAQLIVKNAKLDKPLTSVQMLEKVGYSPNTAEAKAKDIIQSEGVQSELSIAGFTEHNAKAVTAEIMLNSGERASDRLKAAEMTFKVHGTFQPEATNDKNPRIVNIFQNATFTDATRTYEQSLKEIIANAVPTEVIKQPQPDTETEG